MISEKTYNRRYRKKCERLREGDLKPGTIFYINPGRSYWKIREWRSDTNFLSYPRFHMIADFVFGRKPDGFYNRGGSWLETQCIDAIKKKTWTILSIKSKE